MRSVFISLLSFTLYGCLSLAPELEWEDVTSDHDPVLNVFGLLSADSILTSFVRVNRTLDMEEAADSLIRDTIGDAVFIYYISRFLIRDAEVIVSNGVNEYIFEYNDYSFGQNGSLSEVYLYQGDIVHMESQILIFFVSSPRPAGNRRAVVPNFFVQRENFHTHPNQA